MTEHEWDRCSDPQKMLEFLRGRWSQRQFRLFAVACCRRILHLLPPSKSIHRGLEVTERRAEGLADSEEVRRALHNVAYGKVKWACVRLAAETHRRGDCTAADLIMRAHWAICDTIRGRRLVNDLAVPNRSPAELPSLVAVRTAAAPDEERAMQCVWLRDLFGNLFRPMTIGATWLRWNDGTVQKLAQSIYDNRQFGDLPILADALEEAGCADADILAHCRSAGDHIRGCWVIDLILAKK